MSATKYVYDFSEGNASMKPLLGGKGANLAEMTGLGIPVPQGFIVTTEACVYYSANGKYPDGLEEEIDEHLQGSREAHRQDPGRPQEPAAALRPLRRRVLHAGHDGHRPQPGPERRDRRGPGQAHRQPALRLRLLPPLHHHVRRRGHGRRLAGVRGRADGKKARSGRQARHRPHRRRPARPHRALQERSWARRPGEQFPDDPLKQLHLAIVAVFKSWDNHRAKVYRRTQGIPDDLGTAVNVQSMVFGNKGETSGTGVAFTRDPSTGENFFYGEFLMNAQGEDVVAGVRVPRPLEELREVMPEALEQLYDIRETLEKHYRDMQDLEFTIEDTKLYMLQTRNGKRTAPAALKMAVDMVAEGLISKDEALMRVDPAQLDQLLHPRLDPKQELNVLATGLGASPGAAVGKVVFDADEAEEQGSKGEPVILVRWETNPDDIHGLMHSQGVITSHGGMTSHAAVVARGMGKPCIAGVQDMKIDDEGQAVHRRRRGRQGRRLDHHGRRHRPGDPGPGRARRPPASTRTSTPSSAGPTRSAA